MNRELGLASSIASAASDGRRTMVSGTDWRKERVRVAAPATAAAIEPQSDNPTVPSRPTRFPWLSWFSQSVEQATRRRSVFEGAPVLGSCVDRFV